MTGNAEILRLLLQHRLDDEEDESDEDDHDEENDTRLDKFEKVA